MVCTLYIIDMRIYLEEQGLVDKMKLITGFLREKKSRSLTLIYSADGMFEVMNNRVRKILIAHGETSSHTEDDITFLMDNSRLLYSKGDNWQIPFPHVSDNMKITSYNLRPNAPLTMVLEIGDSTSDCYFTIDEHQNPSDIKEYINEFLSLGTNIW
jgi:hypothetical protein